MIHFNWDLMIVIPTAITKLLLANGIVFDNEDIPTDLVLEFSRKISAKAI